MQTKKDSQNQYRTGVLVGNHVEDRFGQDLVGSEADWKTPKTEVQSKYVLENTMYKSGRDNYPAKPVTEDEIIETEKYKDYEEKIYPKRGLQSHIFFGHGASQDAFDKRDFGTTNSLFFDKKMKTETMINPHYYHKDKVKIDYFVTNAKLEDAGTLFKPIKKSDMKPKSYSEYTKKFDGTHNKTGFRK